MRLGTSLGPLLARSWPEARFLVIFGSMPGEKPPSLFESFFRLFGSRFLIDFWRPLREAFCVTVGANGIQTRRLIGLICAASFWDLRDSSGHSLADVV